MLTALFYLFFWLIFDEAVFSQLQVSVCVAAPDATTLSPAAAINQAHSEEDWGSRC